MRYRWVAMQCYAMQCDRWDCEEADDGRAFCAARWRKGTVGRGGSLALEERRAWVRERQWPSELVLCSLVRGIQFLMFLREAPSMAGAHVGFAWYPVCGVRSTVRDKFTVGRNRGWELQCRWNC